MTREEILNALSIENITFGGNSRRLAQFFEALDIVTESYTNIGGDWIPCSERLPKLEEVVLLSVKMDEESMVLMGELWKTGWVLHCDGYDEEDFEFIAWMPLPPAYKGE